MGAAGANFLSSVALEYESHMLAESQGGGRDGRCFCLACLFPGGKCDESLPPTPESHLSNHGDHKQPSALRFGSSHRDTLVSLYSSFFPVTMTSEHRSGQRVSGPTSIPFCHQEGMSFLSHVPIYTDMQSLEVLKKLASSLSFSVPGFPILPFLLFPYT